VPAVPWSVHLTILAGQVCFASLPVVGLLAVNHVPVAAIPLVRTAGGCLLFALIAWRRGTLGQLRRADIPFIALCAVLGNVLNQELFIHGLAHSTAVNAVVLGSTIPVFTILAAIVLGREPVRARRMTGMAIAFAGVAALVQAEQVSTSGDHLLGSVMILANALSYGTYLVIGRPLAERYDPFALLAYMFAIGLPLVAPLGVIGLVEGPALNPADWQFLGFLVLVPTLGAYSFIQLGLRRAESSLVASYVYTQPVFATLGAVFVLDEQVSVRQVLCGAVVLAGVWLAASTATARRASPYKP
jgi:drug/metabolite transporter (DMT)-like permease